MKQLLKYFVSTKFRFMEICIVSLIWFTNIFQNYGLSLEINRLGGDVRINATIVCMTQFLACVMAYPVIKTQKRKRAQIIFFFLTGGASFLYMFVDSVIVKYILVCVMKFGSASSFCIVYVLTTELYPTEIRGLAFGLSNTFGRVGSILATMMIEFSPDVYLSISFILAIVCILLSLLLKETKGLELQDKISQKNE